MDDITCFNILIDTLTKKSNILDELTALTEKQKTCMEETPFHYDLFDSYMDDKEQLIETLNQLDNGFDKVYSHLKSDVLITLPKYEHQIKRLKELIVCITEKSLRLEGFEQSNKRSLEIILRIQKKEVRDIKQNNSMAMKYYKNMSGSESYESCFLDKKK
ncbi:FlgN protein [Anaerocolumna jejuensis DSM 15929]|uniref:FlgN protein n=1 Tax=Anaerocolumna jejuensis DSM 15929 TaxID=1121322 RepID=A0A1M7B575_9FIRM|nr:flagellar export chaperone FlgN [Anaerocolumna jejuensis]SHL50140.1 FlgN protein [Anaerocolumna jejuensis DSM 15929]